MSTSSLRRSNSSKKGNGKEKKVKKTKLSSSVKTNGSSKADSLKELRREESLRSQTTDDQTPPPPPPIGRGTVEPASTFMLPGLGVEDSDTFDSPSRQMSVSFFDRYASKVIDTKHSDKKDSDAVREVATTLLHATSISGLSSELVTLRRNVKEAETAVDTKSKRCDALLEEMEDTYRGYERDTLVSLCNSEELNRETIRWAFSHGVALLAQSMSIAEPQVSGHHAVEINELVHNEWTDRNDIEKLSFKKFSAICESCPLIKDLKDMAEDHLLASHVADINCKLSFAETELVMSETSVRKLQGQLKQMQKDLAKKDELLRDYQTKAPYLNIAQNASGVDVSMSEGNSVGHSLSDAHEEEREKEKEYNVADREWSRSQQPGDRYLTSGHRMSHRVKEYTSGRDYNRAATATHNRSYEAEAYSTPAGVVPLTGRYTGAAMGAERPTGSAALNGAGISAAKSPPFANTRLHAFIRSRSAASRPPRAWAN